MTKLLAIETSTQACSVALGIEDEIIEKFELIPRLHAQQVLPMIEAILAEAELEVAQLDAIAFARGPGSFTGVRIATSVAQGLAFGAELPVLPVSSLATLAQTQFRQSQTDRVFTLLDARMNEVYWGCYQVEEGLMKLLGSEALSIPEEIDPEVDLEENEWVGVGDGWSLMERIPQKITDKVAIQSEACYPHAGDLARLALRDYRQGELVPPELAQPAYLRGKSAWKKSK